VIGGRSLQCTAWVGGGLVFDEHDIFGVSCRPNRPRERRQRSAPRRETTMCPHRPDREPADMWGRGRRTRAPLGR
jgi:hypothetical protein